jgi:uncharacterized protein with NRDE domain
MKTNTNAVNPVRNSSGVLNPAGISNGVNKITWAKIKIDAETILNQVQHKVQHDIEGVIPNLFRNLNVFNEYVTILNAFVLDCRLKNL